MGSKRSRRNKRRNREYNPNFNQKNSQKTTPKKKKVSKSSNTLSLPWMIFGILTLIIFGIATSFIGFNPFQKNKDVKYDEVLEMTNTLPHNTESFTEGLFFYNGKLYESQGEYAKSKLYENINLNTNQAQKEYKFDDQYFAEGTTVLDDKLYVLTYKEHKALVFDPETLELIETIDYPNREGWGLTTDGESLIASDGSSKLYYMDKDMNELKRLTVTEDGEEVTNVNELEYIDGNIWANIWQEDEVVVINPENGEVIKRIDFSELRNGIGEVLNGIAYNPDTEKLYITGKNWNKMYEFNLKSPIN